MEAVGKVYDLALLRPKATEEIPLAVIEGSGNPIRALFEKMAELEDMLAKHQFLMNELNSKLKPTQKIEC
jgi:hypothetical protein